jgi:DNA polymerase I
MTTESVHFLTYHRNTLELDPEVRFFVSDGFRAPTPIDAAAVARWRGNLVSYELWNIAHELRRRSVTVESDILDIVDAVKLATGRPAHGPNDRTFSIWQLLRRQTSLGEQVTSLIPVATRAGVTPQAIETAMTALSTGLRELWFRTAAELESHGEMQRLHTVEVPVGRLLLNASARGLTFDKSVVDARLGELSTKVARAAANLRLHWDVLAASEPSQLARAIAADGHAQVTPLIRQPLLPSLIRAGLDAVLEFLPEHQAVAAEIKAFRAATHDKAVLLHLSALDGTVVYPRFLNMGTVTGRILVRSPALQYISRSSRSILRPRDGREFVYADFAQFEPAIMADDSGDLTLQADYNSGDVYEQFSRHVFGTNEFRDHAKLVFLAFCYGMTLSRVAEMLGRNTGHADEMGAMVDAFLSRYTALPGWRDRLSDELLTRGCVSTRLGNHRKKSRAGKEPSKADQRASLSQRIQGSASLVFKRALLAVEELGCADFVLPMHDAALYEVDSAHVNEARDAIEAAFCRELERECPAVRARVVFKRFCETDEVNS